MARRPHYEAGNDIQELKDPQRWVLKPKAFNIVWGNDKRYWIMPTGSETGQEEAAQLSQVCWLEVTGSTNKPLTKGKKYGISFTIELTDGAFGWNGCPVFLMAKIGRKGKYKWQKINLSDLTRAIKHEIPVNTFTIDVDSNINSDDLVLYFGLYEVWTGRWKGGLNIYEAKVEEIVSSLN